MNMTMNEKDKKNKLLKQANKNNYTVTAILNS